MAEYISAVGTNAEKRRRQQQNRGAGGEAQSRSPRTLWYIAAAVVVAVVASAVVVLGGDDDADEAAEPQSTAECPPVEGATERTEMFSGPPPMCIDAAANVYTATFRTTEGDFTAELDPEAAPNTVNNFVVLARELYYDGVPFHRIVPGFVIQGGDGDGEPWGNNDLGYQIDDELPDSSEAYTDYSLAMANAGPNTNGSQFFVVLPGGGSSLTPDYSWFGQVTEGQDVVDAIGALGGPDQQPTKEVLINTVEITETPK